MAVMHVDKEARATKIAGSLVLHLPDTSKMLSGDMGQKPYRQAGQSCRSTIAIHMATVYTKAGISHLYAALFCGSLSISLHASTLFKVCK